MYYRDSFVWKAPIIHDLQEGEEKHETMYGFGKSSQKIKKSQRPDQCN